MGLSIRDTNGAPQVIYVVYNNDCMVRKGMVLEVGNKPGQIIEIEKGILLGIYIGRIYFSTIWLVEGIDKYVSVGDVKNEK